MKRLGLSYVDEDPRRAEQDRDVVSSVQDLQGVEIEVTTPAVADTEFQLVHGLRVVTPSAVEVLLSDKGGVVYASRKADWNGRRIFLKCTVAADTVLLRVR